MPSTFIYCYLFLSFVGLSVSLTTPTYPANCFFSVAQDARKVWWFVDPNGQTFYSKGVDVITPFGPADTETGVSQYAKAVDQQYNGDFDKWADDQVQRMLGWNINTIGAWSSSYLVGKKMPYAVELSLISSWIDVSNINQLFPDVFHPGFATNTETQVNLLIPQYLNDPYLVGYYIDNELYLGGATDWRADYTILALYLHFSTTSHGYQKAISFLQSKYTMVELNAAWGISSTTWNTLGSFFPFDRDNANFYADSLAFLSLVCQTMFRVTTTAIRKVDPNHLILGVKHAGTPESVVIKADGQYDDVVSFDYYHWNVTQATLDSYAAARRPLLVAEFDFSGQDVGFPADSGGGGILVPNQQARATWYANYVRNVSKSPLVIGTHWFKWADEPYHYSIAKNYGLVDNNNNPYTTLTNAFKSINPTLDTLHGTPGMLTANCKASLPCPNGCSGGGCCNPLTGACACDSMHTGFDCSQVIGELIDTFHTLDTSIWKTSNNYNFGVVGLRTANTVVPADKSTGGVKVFMDNQGCPDGCSGKSIASGGIQTTSGLYGYGTLTGTIKASPLAGTSTYLFWLNHINNLKEGPQLVIKPSDGIIQLSYYKGGVHTVIKPQPTLTFDPTTAYHTYSIKWTKTSVTWSVDNTVLYTLTSNVPVGPGMLYFMLEADTAPTGSLSTGVAYLKQLQYQQATFVPASCPAVNQYDYIGCYQDSTTKRLLTGAAILNGSDNSVSKCKLYCSAKGYKYAGVEYGKQCFCGNSYSGGSHSGACNMPCTGNSAEICGGSSALSIYPTPSLHLGCFVDSSVRDLGDQMTTSNSMTIEACIVACKSSGYKYAGLQNADECHCGSSYGSLGQASASDCNKPCKGDSSEICGGGYRNSVYKVY